MANNLSSNPIQITADIAGFQAAQTLRPGQKFGLSVYKIELSVGSSASVAGTVTITDPITGRNLIPPITVAASVAANTALLDDDIVDMLLWGDFAVTGVTATGTVLTIWYKA